MKKLFFIFFLSLLLKNTVFCLDYDTIVTATWIGEYTGFDPQTSEFLTVRRKLIIEEFDNFYCDTLWGTPSGDDEIIFETEYGTWSITFDQDSIQWSPIVSKRINISTQELEEYERGNHGTLLDFNQECDQWNMEDENMQVNYIMQIDEQISKPGPVVGEIYPQTEIIYTYATSPAISSLGHTIEYQFNFNDELSSWSTDTTATYEFEEADSIYIFVTARSENHTEKTAVSDTLWVYPGYEPLNIEVNSNNVSLEEQGKEFYFRQQGTSTLFSYILPYDAMINLSVYNLKGQLIETLVNQKQINGSHTIEWNNNAETGIYIAVLRFDTYSKILKININ